MADVVAMNAQLQALARQAKAVLLEAVKCGRQLTPAEREQLDELLRAKAEIERQSP